MNILQLSIIVPVYNLENYIGECLDSLLEQNVDIENYEIIVVNDGSTDNSRAILDDYSKKFDNIRVFHKENRGVSSARNFALEYALGDYIWFVDGDDLVAPNVLSDILFEIEKAEFPDVLSVQVKSFIDGEKIDTMFERVLDEGVDNYEDWIVAWFIRKDVINNNKIRFDENVSLSEDDIFQVFINQHIKTFSKLNKVVYFYRQRQGSALHSSITDNNFERYVKSYSACLDYANKYDFFWYKRDMVYKCMPNVMMFIAEKPSKYVRKYIKRLKELKLFPLPKQIKTPEEKKHSVSGAKRIRNISYTRYGYYLLRIFLIFTKIKNKLLGKNI